MTKRREPDPVSWEEGNTLLAEFGAEQILAERITSERQARGWSQSELARQLKALGYEAIGQTVISRIERPGEERRAIRVDEAIAFARVFDLPLGDLMLPTWSRRHLNFVRRLRQAPELLNQIEDLWQEYQKTVQLVAQAAREDDDDALRQRFEAASDVVVDPLAKDRSERRFDRDVHSLLGSPGDIRALDRTLKEIAESVEADHRDAVLRRIARLRSRIAEVQQQPEILEAFNRDWGHDYPLERLKRELRELELELHEEEMPQ